MNLQLHLAAFYYEYGSDAYFFCESVKVDSMPLVLLAKVVVCNQWIELDHEVAILFLFW